jgi:hypothetical protein
MGKEQRRHFTGQEKVAIHQVAKVPGHKNVLSGHHARSNVYGVVDHLHGENVLVHMNPRQVENLAANRIHGHRLD